MKLIKSLIVSLILFSNSLHAKDYPSVPNEINPLHVSPAFCYQDATKIGHSIVLLDITSPLDRAQKDFIRDQFFSKESFIKNTKPFERISFLLIDNNNPQSQKFVFSMCRPNSGDNAGKEKVSMRQSPLFVKKYFKDFIILANASYDKIFSKNINSDSSLIYETIVSVFRNPTYDFGGDYSTRRLFIVSDLMQHSERLSFYKLCNAKSDLAKCPLFAKIKENPNNKEYIESTSPDVSKTKNVEIVLIYLNHRYETNKQIDESLLQLWMDYFKSQGLSNVKIIRQVDLK